jgi:hypothetical protein
MDAAQKHYWVTMICAPDSLRPATEWLPDAIAPSAEHILCFTVSLVRSKGWVVVALQEQECGNGAAARCHRLL